MRFLTLKDRFPRTNRSKVTNYIAILVIVSLLLGSCATERAVRLRDKSINKWEINQGEPEQMSSTVK